MLSGFGLRSQQFSSTYISRFPRRLVSRFQSTSSASTNQSEPDHRIGTIVGEVDLDYFRKVAWVPQRPLILQAFHNLPAIQKWFRHDANKQHPAFSHYMNAYENTIFPYEFNIPTKDVLAEFLAWLEESSEYNASCMPVLVEAMVQSWPHKAELSFQQFDSPLHLIMSACHFNQTRHDPNSCIKNLYIAQSSLNDLPVPLSRDLPVPDIVMHAGKGHVYNSSIWLGLQPTYTPLHRDPNPNLFCQLVNSKKIRLMTPDRGDDIYAYVRRKLGSQGNSRFRGPEMMKGQERELLHDAVWNDGSIDEVHLHPGDALFIPLGWWHSVASYEIEGKLNASVNWWFR
ncbi:Clavaminate synthase-like protein [Hypoxylon trugodes]|uniref:Clavaminate synthase-like protein n=1 Tax=Hypoxylon trugodes TaxID=326681 RepID=UPI00218D192D|nr:Clavaminate synthase-like protein [Hypoxylon trugodes]KAI1387654.1 Clavaminate synthase-like protein [Hypoxylon trugodes]